MGKRRFLHTVALLGVVMLAAACGSNEPEAPRSESATATTTVTTSATTGPPSGTAPPAQGAPTAGTTQVTTEPPSDSTPAGEGTVIIRTQSLSGVAIPYVPVRLTLHQPCNPTGHDLPEGTPETQRWDATTDLDGKAVITVPTGCYRLGMTAPPGTNPVPEGLHTLFLESSGQTVTGQLRFQDPAPGPLCAGQTIVHDLNVESWLREATPTVTNCDGFWAVIVWDVPGDSQRIVSRTPSTPWSTYVGFPHDVCWSTARADGVPDSYEKYFSTC
ncbi:hypothetical protein H0264_31455 [Nocardia huaxiensis]|uniref:Uncharacterized protein n=1 Tax=Nocardia huaxiensis TaxID=2755382 RepID=A0A7D6ZGE8_9NOCA|nr:hypothetical protein [Nocardia huaxiensis]QLY29707.1 hypothetical protein H0264_31455 [Nocardia huaxiensis]